MLTKIDFTNLALSSDIHLGDPKHAKGYGMSLVEYADQVISEINQQINENTTLIMVGDTICNRDYIPYLRRLKCKKLICVMGNRESRRPEIIASMVEEGYGCQSSILQDGILITHIPPHSSEASRFRKVIHGHLHYDHIFSSKYVNISAPVNKYKVKWFKDIDI